MASPPQRTLGRREGRALRRVAFYYGGAWWGITVGAVPLNQFSQIVAKRPVGLEFLLVK